MFPETEKKLRALSVEDRRALDRWCSAHTDSKSLDAFLDGVESRANEPFSLDAALGTGRLMVKAGIAEGFEDALSFAD